MALFNISFLNTFAEWMALTNQLVVINNNILEGYWNKTTGTIELSNRDFSNANVTLNVSNGYIKGNGAGLTYLKNTSLIGVMTNAQLQNSSITLFSNTAALVLETSSASLGTGSININLKIDSTTTNTWGNVLASAQAVNSVQSLAQTNNTQIRTLISDSSTIGSAAYAQAYTARTHANSAFANANTTHTLAITAISAANAAFANANGTNILTIASFAAAKAAFANANGTHSLAVSSIIQANTARTHANSAYGAANAAFDKANTASQNSNVSFGNVYVQYYLHAPTAGLKIGRASCRERV